MCRWFAYVSPVEPCLLADVLILPANAITKQCSDHYLPYLLPFGEEKTLSTAPDALLRLRNSLLNIDGVGIAWYTNSASAYNASQEGSRPALYKSQSPPTNDFNFRNICENTETFCLMAHIRASSGSPVTPVNNHPFVFGRHTFMHNGVVSDFTRIRRPTTELLSYDAFENIHGSTDSEHLAALYITHLCGPTATHDTWQQQYPLDQMATALARTVTTVLELQHTALGRDAHANSLNLCVTDGRQMVACRFRNHDTQQPPSLYWSEFAGRTLNRKYPGDPDGGDAHAQRAMEGKDGASIGKHTIVTSEPTTYDESEWMLIEKNYMILVDGEGVETHVPLNYDASLNAA